MTTGELEIDIYNPAELCTPLGQYSNLTRVSGARTTVYIAGMVAVDRDGNNIGVGNISKQIGQVFENIRLALAAEDLNWPSVAQFTTYITDAAYIPDFMEWRKNNFPGMFKDGKYPPNTLLVVKRLLREEFLIEIQSIAVK